LLRMAQAIVLHPVAVPLKPVWGDVVNQPLRREGGEIIQDGTQRFSDAFHVGERADTSQHMRRIGALLATRFEPASLLAHLQEPIQQEGLLPALHQTQTKFGQD
jgi:hypothetical protein